ncbi:hypothetical protein J2W15_001888 [Pseudarthrobacter sulfonivorans]|nr:hypothetical protein [Pseudarthrobacter sulfonivorans]
METSDYARFIQDCIATDPVEDHGPTEDEMYGVYLSWCILHGQLPAPCKSFWMAMAILGLRTRRRINRRYIRPGLRITGPAALDYILANRPSLL